MKKERLDPKKREIETAFDLAAPHYEGPELGFWHRFADELVEHADIKEGDRVIDFCCGSGAVALAAARKVGSRGRVLGIDLSSGLLEIARANAEEEMLDNVEFVEADMESFSTAETFDVATCGFALFFFDDMKVPLAKMTESLHAGGTVAVSLWGEGYWEPFNTLLDKSIARHLGIEGRLFNRKTARSHREVATLLSSVGLADVRVTSSAETHPVHGLEGWWQVVLGSGYQGTLRHLTSGEVEKIKAIHFEELTTLVDEEGFLRLVCPVYLAGGVRTVQLDSRGAATRRVGKRGM